MNKENIESVYRLTPVQQGMLLETLRADTQSAYHEQFLSPIEWAIDFALLERIWQSIVDRNPILRTAVLWEGLEQPVQVVFKQVKMQLEIFDWRSLPAAEQQRRVREHAAEERQRGFDLLRPPLLRLAFFRLGNASNQVLWSYHHLILDGWSVGQINQEVAACLAAGQAGRPAPYRERRPFRDYVAWLLQQDTAASEVYWRGVLGGFSAPTPLGIDRPAGPGEDRGRSLRSTFLPAAETEELKGWARRHRLTVGTLVQATWALVLSRLSGEDDVVFGVTVSGRPPALPGVEAMLGCFVNTLPVRARMPASEPLLSWVQSFQSAQLELRRHEATPLVRVMEWSTVPRPAPLFESIVVIEAFMETAREEAFSFQRTGFPLTLVAGPVRELVLRIDFDRRRLDPAAAERLLGYLRTALALCQSDPGRRLGELELLPPAERRELLADGAPAVATVPAFCLHRRFAEQAARTPQAPAVTCEGTTLAYGELNERANRLAHRLCELGVGPEARVGLLAERSLEMIVGILGILKAGGAYVPLDPRSPAARLAVIAEEAGFTIVVTVAALEGMVPQAAAVVRLDADAADLASAGPEDPVDGAQPDNLAYVIFTSGSTGRPKGSLITHRNAARLFTATAGRFGYGPHDVWSLFHSLAFDFSVWEVWGALLYGGRLVVVPYWVSRSPQAFCELLVREQVTVLSQTPSAFRQLVQADEEGVAGGRPALRAVVFGGEALELSNLAPWLARYGDRRPLLVNMYGITETTVHVTWRRITAGDLAAAGVSPIGGPLPDLGIHLLDRRGHLVARGVPGEIHVAGAGLARGYLGRPDLTAERFVPDPFGPPGSRLYRSGDLARRTAERLEENTHDGGPPGAAAGLNYLGRIDHQVKVRGFRIELGEIEAALLAHPGVREAAVLARGAAGDAGSADLRLIAWVARRPGAELDLAGLRSHLRDRLPDHMVPARLVEVPSLPLTAHGKLDRGALPEPSGELAGERSEPPRTPTEELLAEVWCDVLGVARVRRNDDFFDLGGHSLLVTRVLARLRELFGVDLPLRALFAASTLADLAVVVDAALAAGNAELPSLQAVPREGRPAPLSWAQERLWFLDRLQPGQAVYNLPAVLRFTGPLDVAALAAAFAGVVRRHETLRTTFAVADGQPAQVTAPPSSLPAGLALADLSALPAVLCKPALSRFTADLVGQPFDLAAGPLVRGWVVRLGRADHALVFVLHHIISDGWSNGVLVRELAAFYGTAVAAEPAPAPLPPLPVQYADFAAWQRGWLAGPALERQIAWWRERLAGAPAALSLPLDRPRPLLHTSRGRLRTRRLPATAAGTLLALGRRRGATPFMTLFAGWAVLLARATGELDLTVGTPIANRTRAEIEGLIGFFVNTLVLRVELGADASFAGLLAQVREQALGAYTHQDLPFQKLVEELAPERSLQHTPLFEVMFAFEEEPPPPPPLPGLTPQPIAFEQRTAQFDLHLTVRRDGDGLQLQLGYNTDLFRRGTVERLLGHLAHLLEAAAESPQRRVLELPLLSAAERHQLLAEWNDTAAAVPDGRLHDAFFAQAERRPDATAMTCGEEALSYGELAVRARRLAAVLRAAGVGPEVRVGLCLERSPELLVGLLGALAAGGAWVPLDPAHPAERLRFLLADSATPVLLTRRALAGALAVGERVTVLCLDEPLPDAASLPTAPSAPAAPDNLAYVIYTSGSTGTPNGVLVPHRGAVNLIHEARRLYRFGPQDRMLQTASPGFDLSVAEVFLPLSHGAGICVVRDEERLTPAVLTRILAEQGVSAALITPSLLSLLPSEPLATLRALGVAGEALPGELAARWARGGRRLLNCYGPTEASVFVTAEAVAGAGEPSIGRPLANLEVHVVDAALAPVPAGVAGELVLGGVALARGYLGRPARTAEKFVPSPFPGRPGSRLYRTGDMARRRSDGRLEFLGRFDDQVKVRGIRIEPGEIESALLAHPDVASAVVLAPPDRTGERRLVAYVVGRGGGGLSVDALRRFLAVSLPAALIPAHVLVLPALPVTPGGKVDRRALPDPEDDPRPGRSRVPPRTAAECLVAGLWQQVLGVEQVSAHDDFFALGGSSIKAALLTNLLQEELGEDVPVVALFEAPTPERLAAWLLAALPAAMARATGPAVPEGGPSRAAPEPGSEPEEPAPLSFAQERLWFLDQLAPGTPAYHVVAALRIDGVLDRTVLGRCLDQIAARHAALRTTFRAGPDGAPVQVVAPALDLAPCLADLSSLPESHRAAASRDVVACHRTLPFDLARGPLVRAALVRWDEARHVLSFAAHHIVCDGWSIGVLLGELAAFYADFAAGRPPSLPPLALQYPDFARRQRRQLAGDALEAQLAWWREQLAGVPVLQLPTDRPRPAVRSLRGAACAFAFPPALTDRVRALGREHGATDFMALLAGLAALLARASGQSDFALGSPVAGRGRRELEPMIGFFVNTLVLRARVDVRGDVRSLLAVVRATALAAYAHQDVPFERVVQELAPERSLSHTPLFQVMLAFQNTPAAGLALPGLTLAALPEASTTSQFDLSLTVFDHGPQLAGQWVFSTALFDPGTVASHAGRLEVLLAAMADHPGRPVAELALLTPEEREQILVGWNRPALEYDDAEPFAHRLFERVAAERPDAIALSGDRGFFSYRCLDGLAGRLAQRLRRCGVGPGATVGVTAARSPELVVGLLGVLKSGAAYLPIDPELPSARQAFLGADTGIGLLLAGAGTNATVPAGVPVLPLPGIDGPDESPGPGRLIAGGNGTARAVPLDPGHPAYVIYTSGSTGRPKGVVISHFALGNRMQYARAADSSTHYALLQRATLGFDVAISEILSALVAGGRIVLAPPGPRQDVDELVRVLAEQRVTWASFPPTLLAALLEHEGFLRLTTLQDVVTGGEAVPPALPELFYARLPWARLLNRYGPTEATISVMAWTCERGPAAAALPIGWPMANTRVYLLDGAFQPVPVGIAGEIFLGGACLAEGYLRRPDATAAAFVPDPFAARPGERLYRTGDLARRRPDGAVEFVGRVDQQVKVRGFRIELGEVEAVLACHPDVREAAVVVRGSGADRSLTAFVVPRHEAGFDAAALRRFLLAALPAYMVPVDLAALDALPLSATGKVDRQALAALRPAAAEEGNRESAASADEVEEIICGVFAEVLGRRAVAPGADFFALGGHSLLATRVVARLRALLGVDLALRQLFEHPTGGELAHRIRSLVVAGGAPPLPAIVPVPRGQPLPLSFGQERLWFIHQLEPESAAYNLAAAVRLDGDLDTAALVAAAGEIVRRHEVLRTTFIAPEGRPVQVVAPPAPVEVAVRDLSGDPRREERVRELYTREAERPFALAAGPLLRLELLQLGPREHVLVVTMHHIVSDGWSVGVFVRELAALYGAFRTGAPSPLAELPVQYSAYAVWQRGWLAGEVLEAQIGWWRERLAGAPEVLELPADRPRPAVRSARGASVGFAWPSALSQSLAAFARGRGATLYMALMAGFQALLARYGAGEDLPVGTPVANRSSAALEGLIGFFVNTLVLRGDVSGGPGFATLLDRVRTDTLGGFAHQDLPFEKLVEALRPERSRSHAPLFQVLLVLQNTPWEEMQLPGLVLARLELPVTSAPFDLILNLGQTARGVHGLLTYASDLFDEATAARLARHLEALVAAAVTDPESPLGELPLLTAGELAELRAAGAGEAGAAGEASVVRQVLARAAAAPETPAVAGEGGALTYGKLAARALGLAARLQGRGVGPESVVALLLPRSPDLAVASLAVMAAGGAFLPLDPTLPPRRLATLAALAAGTGCRVLVSRRNLAAAIGEAGPTGQADRGLGLRLLLVDDVPADGIGFQPVAVQGGNLAYQIYTSGSTGTPKAISVAHEGLANLVAWSARTLGVDAGSRAAAIAGVGFDASVLELWGPLCAGASVWMPPAEVVLDPAALLAWMAERRITHALPTAAVVELLLRAPLPADLALRVMLSGGDRLRARPPADARFRLLNCYGPTETTVIATAGEVMPAGTAGNGLPDIGRPIAGLHAQVFDAGLRPVPAGAPGELCLGGAGLARGYAGRPDLTAAAFVPDPVDGSGGRLYRTGDRVRWAPGRNGGLVLEFLGRIDQQVKVRGFRIEPGEIEVALAAHPGVREAAVVVREDRHGDKRLVAYVAGIAAEDELSADLAARLPAYMMPAAIMTVAALPLTSNGKVDRARLAELAEAMPGEAPGWTAPRTPTEDLLAALWADLLGMERVGLQDDFFQLGGHSLLAARVAARIRASFGVELPLRRLFELPQLADLAQEVDRAVRERRGLALPPLLPAPRTGDLPLSFAQGRLWFLDRLQPGSPAYNVPAAIRLLGRLDLASFRASLRETVRRHEALRTTFAVRPAPGGSGRPVQVIAAAPALELPLVDLSALPAGHAADATRQLAAKEGRRPFDLAAGPLLRCLLVRQAAGEHLAVLTLHHVAADGWSIGLLLRELAALYSGFASGAPAALPEPALQYADYAVWQRSWLHGETLAAEIAWWRERLRGAPPLLALPTDRPRPPLQRFNGRHHHSRLAAPLAGALAVFCRREGVTQFMGLLAAFQALLGRHSGSDDVIVGTPVAGRTLLETEEIVGLFVNSLVLRTGLGPAGEGGEPGFATLAARARATTLDAYAHQELPFEKIVEELAPERNLSHAPLFQVMLSSQDSPDEPLELPGLTLVPVELVGTTAKLDLTLTVHQQGGELLLGWLANRDLFDAPTVARLAGHLAALLAAALADPGRPAGGLPLLSSAEEAQLREWNDTARPYPTGVCLHELVAAQAARTPAAVAVRAAGRDLTYGELDAAARRLAHRLAGLGVGPEVPVGVCAERSHEMVITLLGVLQAGGAYLPLDPDYPPDRLAYMLGDAGAPVVLAQPHLTGRLPALPNDVRLLALDLGTLLAPPDSAALPATLPASGVEAGNLAYVIYTSGSTGRPKGTMNTHGGIVNRLLWMQERFGLTTADRVLQKTPFTFDVSVWELFWPLITGARLVVERPGGHLDPGQIVRRLQAEGITTVHFVPSMLQAFLAAPGVEACTSVTRIITGAETLPAELEHRFHRGLAAATGVRLFNLYGPTEAAIDVTSWSCDPTVRRAGVPIGRPVANTAIHRVDRHFQRVPTGVPGDLCIGGVQVGRGYIGRPDLTAERFVPDSFAAEPGARLYRTGDLVRALPDGAIEFLGRIDHQVKIRGLRIELGEIEAVVAAHPAVRQAVVLPRAEGPQCAAAAILVAYLTLQADAATPAPAELRGHAARTLPEHMVPAAWVVLDVLPLNPNGKVDRKALARVAPERRGAPAAVGPRSAVEAGLAELWAGFLGIPAGRLGMDDNFFEVGGNSITAALLVNGLQEMLGKIVHVVSVFDAPTIASLAAFLESEYPSAVARVWAHGEELLSPPATDLAARLGYEAAAADEPTGWLRIDHAGWREGEPLPLSFPQERLWFFEQMEPGTAAYHMPAVFRLRGRLDVAALGRSLDGIVRRHAVLRTTYGLAHGRPVQQVDPHRAVPLPLVDLADLPLAAREAEIRAAAARLISHPFDLARGPVLRATLLRAAQDDHVALFVIHHIANDGWSNGILVRELAAGYEALLVGRPPRLPELPLQYPDYAVWQRRWFQGARLAGEIAFWREALAGTPVLDLPTDRPRPAVQTYRGGAVPVQLETALLRRLAEAAAVAGATPFMLLLAGFAALLARYSGQDDFALGSPVANRTRAQTEHLIGCFANTVTLRTRLDGEPTWCELVARARRIALAAYAHQELPFERVVEEVNPQRDLSRPPLFQALLALQNVRSAALVLPGVALAPFDGGGETVAKFDLALWLSETAGGVRGALEVNRDLFDPATAERLAGHLHTLLAGAAERPRLSFTELPLLSLAELGQLAAGNATAAPLSATLCAHQLFELHAERAPDARALVFWSQRQTRWRGECLTYRKLDERANRLARHLRRLGVGAETLVGICLERSPQLVVAVLAVLKAGGAYVPLDPRHPRERTAAILAESGAAVLLTETAVMAALAAGPFTTVHLDDPADAAGIARQPASRPAPVGPTNELLAYVIYTSGSTGQPKGVQVSHRSLLNFLSSMAERPGLAAGDVFLAVTTLSFDMAVPEVFLPLVVGGCAAIAPTEAAADGAALASLLDASRATVFQATPTTWRLLLEAGWEGTPGLRGFIGAEAVPRELADRILDRIGELWHFYGPTETTVWSTAIRLEPGGPVSLGTAFANTDVHLLDRALQPVPAGVRAECWIGGAGVTRGYLGRPELTAERYLPNPFAGEPGARLYRTGDLVRRQDDGVLEFLGRADFQVKIRGFRIELSEIEEVLARHEQVRQAVVAVRDGQGGRRLVAYVVPRGRGADRPAPAPPEAPDREAGCDVAALRTLLREQLPDFMVPAGWVVLPELPLTPNGKVDRKALPAPEAQVVGGDGHQLPRSAAEWAVAAVWIEALGLPTVGMRDNFFDLGGHSLLLVQVQRGLRQRFGRAPSVLDLFRHPTAEALAAAMGSVREAPEPLPPNLVALRPEGAAAPLFLVHPISGELLLYRHLAATLGPDRPVYGFEARGFTDGGEPLDRIEDIAALYTDALLALRPEGPYLLAGSSLGGLVAFEMARVLRARGREAALVALLDARLPAGHADLGEGEGEAAILHAATGGRAVLPADWPLLDAEQRLAAVLELGRKHGAFAPRFGLDELRTLTRVVAAHHRALQAYAPQRADVAVTYLRAAESPDGADAWPALALGGVHVEEVPGDHISLHFPPNVTTTAARLRACVDRVLSALTD